MAAGGGARLLDLTRLVSRAGRGPATGIDRVERAYLHRFLSDGVPLYGLVRTGAGFVLLDHGGAAALAARIDGAERWGPPDILSRLTRRGAPIRQAAETCARQLARARAPAPLLGVMLRRHLPRGTWYYNTGHTNLAPLTLAAIRSVPGARAAVLIHDTIPLDHPQFCRPGTPARFAGLMRAVGAAADLVICNSHHSAAAAERHFARLGRVPPGIVAHLGVDAAVPDAARIPRDLPRDRPFFLAIGTIEPRKNHALLLDAWEGLHRALPDAAVPRLFILGARGWAGAATLSRLDALPFRGRTLFERAGVGDGAVAALMAEARGLLFPSLAEGYGLPPLEAAAAGLPVLCGALPVYRETLGDYPVYLSLTNAYPWRRKIMDLAMGGTTRRRMSVPTWGAHFNAVLSRAG